MSYDELERELARLRAENSVLKAALSFRDELLEERTRRIQALTKAEAHRLIDLTGVRNERSSK